VELSNGETLATQTLVWTAGVTPPRVLQRLPVKKEKGRIVVNEMLEVPGFAGVWAIGDCAWIPDGNSGKPHPPTAQHALREAVRCAKKHRFCDARLAASTLSLYDSGPARYHRASRRSGGYSWTAPVWLSRLVAVEDGLSCQAADVREKAGAALRWTLDFAFPRDLTQHVTLHGIDRVNQLLAYVRQHPVIPQPAASATSSALQSSS
jgi:Pyridine nucleotide-disulphide oxidoreductase